jgi:hypothetical protein
MRRVAVLVGAAFFCAPFLPFPAAAQSAGTKEDLSVMAGKMLDATNQARVAIKGKNKSAALDDVGRAQTCLRNIQAHARGATMIPVYQEFVSISMLQPVIAEQEARENQNKNAPAVVHQVAGDYNVAVSTVVAERNLAAARTAIEHGNWNLADRALSDVQEGVNIEEVQANMPLARARENLILARSAAEKSNYAEEQAALKTASDALATYIKSGRPHAADARTLKQQIDSFEGNVQQNQTQAVAKINQWWNTTSDWTPYKPEGTMSASRYHR